MAPFPAPLRPLRLAATRRGFLRLSGTTAALTALAGLRAVPPAAAAEPGGTPVFDETEREILTALMERMVDTGDPAAPAVRDTRAVATVETLCETLDPGVVRQLRLGLRLFEYGPLVFELTLARFTGMSDARKDASLRGWMESRFALRRLAFLGLRNVCLLGYYSQEETWPLIGYAGPLLRPEPSA